ncbi:MAG: tetratricopeptide repeat protein [Bacteroidales bacterium]|nr:tetratricopeptide repeat protein [Bacteroidales bacterium]
MVRLNYFTVEIPKLFRRIKIIISFTLILLPFIIVPAQKTMIDSLESRLEEVKDEDKVQTLIALSYNYLRISVEKSLEYSNKALELSEKIDYQRGKAISYNMMAIGYSSSGDYNQGINYQLKALKIFEDVNDKKAIGINSNNIGIMYKNLGNYSYAIKYYQKALLIARETNNNEGSILSLNNIGIVYLDWHKYDMALEYFQKTLDLLEESEDRTRIAVLLNNIGEVYYKNGKYDLAKKYYQKSIKISEELGAKKGILNSLKHIGDLYYHLHNNKNAIDNYKKSLYISEEIGDKASIAYSSIKIGEVYTSLKKYSDALPFLEKGLRIAEEIEETKLKKDAYISLSEYYTAKNNINKAFEYYKLYTIVKDSLFNSESRREITEMQTKYETEKKEKEIKIQKLEIDKQKNQKYYLAFFILFLVVVAFLIFNRYKLKQKHYRIELERKNLEIEQRLLRTQMNPHFIFNSLNSINSFITDNNSESAQSFLSKFSRLMRYILENSRKPYVAVEDEINTLQLNMELEQLRFDYKFAFTINVSPDIDVEYTYIPPMLIQPFIENAIIHGITNKPTKGNININMKIEGIVMLCSVIDDGIGREKAIEIKKQSNKPKHKSLGMQLTNERLALLNDKSKSNISVEIIDLKDDNDKAKGTKVELRIPFEIE